MKKEYPKMIYHKELAPIIVNDQDEHDMMLEKNEGWGCYFDVFPNAPGAPVKQPIPEPIKCEPVIEQVIEQQPDSIESVVESIAIEINETKPKRKNKNGNSK